MAITSTTRLRRRSKPEAVGTQGNERLTATTAIVLLGLLVVEGVTVLFIRPLLPVHLFVGLMLIPPVLLKLGATGYRFARYYTGSKAYREKGPPNALMRGMAPLVVLTTLALLGSGVWLLLAGPAARHSVLPIHQASFFVWLAVVTVHILGHVRGLGRVGSGDYRHATRVSGRARRQVGVAVAIAAGLAVAVLMLPHFGAWEAVQHFRFSRPPRPVG